MTNKYLPIPVSSIHGLKIKTATNKPCFVKIVVTAWYPDGKQLTWNRNGKPWPLKLEAGASVAPQNLKGLSEPEDFDQYLIAFNNYPGPKKLEVRQA